MSIDRHQPYWAQVADALRADIRAGVYAPGDQLPSERELRERFGVSGNTAKAAIVQLRTEGLAVSHQGRGVFVAEQTPFRRLSRDIGREDGFYTALERSGRRPATVTTVERGPASDEVADALGVPAGTEVVIRARLMRAEGEPPKCLATSYHPTWVVDAAPNLADPHKSGQPTWLREAFGKFYSTDQVDVRRATEDEARKLEVEPGSPVLIIKGMTFDQRHRPLQFIDIVSAPDGLNPQYTWGAVPEGEDQPS